MKSDTNAVFRRPDKAAVAVAKGGGYLVTPRNWHRRWRVRKKMLVRALAEGRVRGDRVELIGMLRRAHGVTP